MKLKYELMQECKEYCVNKPLEVTEQPNEQVIEKDVNVRENEDKGVSEAFNVRLPIEVVE